jgi:RHS repeat-associated protein
MVKNLDKNISEIKYNVLNLPSQITTGADKEYKITYTYDALGRKLQAYYRRKTMDVIIPKRQQARSITLSSRFDGIIGEPVLPDTLVKDTMSTAPSEAEWLSSKITYSGNLIFTGNRVTVLNPHGYTTIDTNKTTGEQTTTRYYYLKDHLGSNRVIFRGDGTVVQQNHYYAYGGLTAESTGGDVQTFKYNGKEFDRKLGIDLYDYGARWYDPVGSSSFTTIDPLCEKYYSVSPYAYCINNPIKYIDPTGMDYWSTSDSYEINRFFQSWQSGSNIDYSGWNHTSDADFLANLSYNDKTGNFLYSYGAEENGELVCYGKVFPSLRDTKTSLNIANDVVNNFGSTLNKNAGNSTVGSNGHFYWHSGMERGFYGNQYVSTMSLAKFGRGITKVTGPIGVALSFSEIYEGYQQDKGVGYNTVHASADVGGGYVGGALGLYSFTEVGAAIGAPFGPGGMIVVGFIGATLGSIVGSYCATQITDRCYGY